MNALIKYTLIALLLVVGVIALSVCADSCSHVCCTGGDRSRPLQRLARRLRSAFRSVLDVAMLLLGGTSGGTTAMALSPPTPLATLQVSALRI